MSVNIGASNADDAFYRYKMPKLQARIEGRGNGIKTNVVNNCDIAKALDRPPDYILKYFGCELGALTTYDAKTGTCIVNGAHDTNKLVEKLEGFIKKYVQCYNCGNPETVFKIKKDSIKMKCKACGGESVIDMSQERHSRLNNYIIKHPPEPKVSKAEKKLQKAEKERLKGLDDVEKKEKKEKKSKEKKDKSKSEKENKEEKAADAKVEEVAEEESPEEAEEDDDDVQWMADTSEEAARQRAKEQLTAATAAMVHAPTPESPSNANGHGEDEDVESRKAAEAERKKAEEARLLEETRKKLAVESDEEESDDEDDVVEELRELAGKVSPEKMASALQSISGTIEGGVIGLMKVLYQALFGAPGKSSLAALVKKHGELLKLHAEDPTQQLAQLMAMEHLLVVDIPDRSQEVEGMLSSLHELDIVSDDVMQAWRNKVAAGRTLGITPAQGRALRDSARRFFEYLEAQDSDEEEEVSDDE